ncbi:MAG: hypothetical protein ABSA47_18150 [Verrucomicrobiota bacterium]|jgi:hypothetical protein
MNSAIFQRHIPLLCLAGVLGACLLIPLRIIGYDFVPAGDARRHVAKALIDKEYPQIVVLPPEYKVDQSPGWDWILRHLHRATGWGEDGLMSFSVVATLLCVLAAGLPWLRRPEAWLAALLAQLAALPDLMVRLDQGRPYLVSEGVLICLLFGWAEEEEGAPSRRKIGLTVIGFALSVWVHGTWYLWVLVPAAFFLAGAWRRGVWLSACWVAGTLLGALLTGHPVDFLHGAVFTAGAIYRQHVPAWMLVGEFQPSEGEFYTLALLALVYLWRLRQIRAKGDLLRQPLFWVIALCWTLGFQADRFWADWGMPAATVWLALQLDEAMEETWPAFSARRLLVCGLIAVPLFLDSTSDLGVRYTRNHQESFVDASDPALEGWLPEEGGIFYTADMSFFYNTFYKNPRGDWRYILGFEPALMPEEDLEILRDIQWSRYNWASYKPWIRKMRAQDRLEIPGAAQPAIPELEWRLAAKDIWIGRPPPRR